MRYDLKLLHELCQESGLSSRISSDLRVEVDLGENCTLFFENFDGEDDCMVGFDGAVSHGHGDFIFAGRGCTAELNYLDVITGLKDGTVLICERWLENKLHDR